MGASPAAGVLQRQRALLQRGCGVAELVLLRRPRERGVRVHLASRVLAAALRLPCLLAFGAMVAGCAERRSVPAKAAAGAGERCETDSHCLSGFCDLGRCAAPQGTYGRSCTPAPLTPEGIRDGKLHVCGAYPCIQERCRSCVSDEQCRSELGSQRCLRSAEHPGDSDHREPSLGDRRLAVLLRR
jgi:hypothetical protein